MSTLRTWLTWSLIFLLLGAGVCRAICALPTAPMHASPTAVMPCCDHPAHDAAISASMMNAAHPTVIASSPFLTWPPLAVALLGLLLALPSPSYGKIDDVRRDAAPPYLRTRRLRL